MLYVLVIVVHVIASLILISVILLQAGRGGGLSETLGGDSSQTIFGTKASVFLTRATVAAACVFLIASLLLGIMTSRRGRSLIDLQVQGGKATPLEIPQKLPK
jgi:preprotein translocase subunit SecG